MKNSKEEETVLLPALPFKFVAIFWLIGSLFAAILLLPNVWALTGTPKTGQPLVSITLFASLVFAYQFWFRPRFRSHSVMLMNLSHFLTGAAGTVFVIGMKVSPDTDKSMFALSIFIFGGILRFCLGDKKMKVSTKRPHPGRVTD